MAERASLVGENPVEAVHVDIRALELCPGIVLVVGGIDLADRADGNAALALIVGKSFERRGGEDAAKVPNHSFDHVIPRRHPSASSSFDKLRMRKPLYSSSRACRGTKGEEHL